MPIERLDAAARGPARGRSQSAIASITCASPRARILATVGAFRVVPRRRSADGRSSPDAWNGDLRRLADQGLIERRTVVDQSRADAPSSCSRARARRCSTAHRDAAPTGRQQQYHAGLVKPRELAHDAQLYRLYQAEAARIEDDGGRVDARRARLRAEARLPDVPQPAGPAGRRRRRRGRCAAFAAAHQLPIVDGHLELPDLRIEYETADGRLEYRDVELVTEHYSRGQLAGKSARRLRALSRGRRRPRAAAVARARAARRSIRTIWSGSDDASTSASRRSSRCGFTPRQARFLVTVALHSGYCLRRQYMAFAGAAATARTCATFSTRLVARRLAERVTLPRRSRPLYHLHARAIYRALRQDDNRNRRARERRRRSPASSCCSTSSSRMPDVEWYATEDDKVALFTQRCGVPLARPAAADLRVVRPADARRPRGTSSTSCRSAWRATRRVVHFVDLATRPDAGRRSSSFCTTTRGCCSHLPAWTIVVVGTAGAVGAAGAAGRVFDRVRARRRRRRRRARSRRPRAVFRRRAGRSSANDLAHALGGRSQSLSRGAATRSPTPPFEALYARWLVERRRACSTRIARGPSPRAAARGQLVARESAVRLRASSATSPGVC